MTQTADVAMLTLAVSALATARRADFDDAELAVYVDLLADLDAEQVDAACRRLGRTPRQPYQPAMPDVSTIRKEVADLNAEARAAERRAKLLPAPSDEDPRTWVCCPHCADTGFQSFRCPGISGADSGRDEHLPARQCRISTRAHAAHTYAEHCPCVDTNPVIAQRRDRARSFRRDPAA